MARYKVKEKSFIDNRIVEAGEEIEHDGIPHNNLEPLDKPAEKAATGKAAADKASAERMKDAALGADLNDPNYKGAARPEQGAGQSA